MFYELSLSGATEREATDGGATASGRATRSHTEAAAG